MQTHHKLQLRILETTDLHSNIMDYDYYRDTPTEKYGLVRTASLIRQARSEVTNSMLFDNGDLLQGSPMGDYCKSSFTHNKVIQHNPIYTVMNALKYDAACLGNHEFNFGLPFLEHALKEAQFPYVCSNITLEKITTNKPLVPKFLIINKNCIDENGQTHCLRVGIIGVVPPHILFWDMLNLTQLNKAAGFKPVLVEDMFGCVQKQAKFLKTSSASHEKVDLVIVLSHSGYTYTPENNYIENAENCANHLTAIPEVDAVLSGHAHAIFPPKNLNQAYEFSNLPDTDFINGRMHGKPTTMPGFWGDHLGIIDLTLEKHSDKNPDKNQNQWHVIHSKSSVKPIFDTVKNMPLVSGEADLRNLITESHENTRAFVNQPIGKNNSPIFSYLALIQDDPSVQIIARAQRAHALIALQPIFKAHPEYKNYPILSAAAPFKSGGRKNDPDSYVEIMQGDLCYRHCADLYSFPNTFAALKITGSDLIEWLECSASIFNQVDTQKISPQYLINWAGFRTYNFDIIEGLEYEIDLTSPAKYGRDCELINETAHRIKNVTLLKKPIKKSDQFIILTNNYRAFGNKFAGANIENILLSTTDELPDIIAQYISNLTSATGYIDIKATPNWSFSHIKSPLMLDLRFETANSIQADNYIANNSHYLVKKIDTDNQGFAVYNINLQAICSNS